MNVRPQRTALGLLALAAGLGLSLLLALALTAGYRDPVAGAWFGDHFLAPGYGGFALILLGVAWRLLRPVSSGATDPDAPAGPAAANVHPVAVPPEDIELQEGAVFACLRCGSRAIQHVPAGAGFFPEAECRRCLYRGMPMQFDNTTGYRQFVKGLQPEAPEPETPGAR